jgi:hypothetical protein
MGKLKQAMIEAQEQFFSFNEPPDLSMDDLIKEDVFFRYGIDLPTAQRVMSLMRLSPPPEAVYVYNPDVYEIWLKEFLNDTNRYQLELFDEGNMPWVWER